VPLEKVVCRRHARQPNAPFPPASQG
jgi:hypothetical protein